MNIHMIYAYVYIYIYIYIERERDVYIMYNDADPLPLGQIVKPKTRKP